MNPNISSLPNSTTCNDSKLKDEIPFLEELGLNKERVFQKTLAMLNPLRKTDAAILQDTDWGESLGLWFVLNLAFGGLLLFPGKSHFIKYIPSISVLGCSALYVILNLISFSGMSVSVALSILGYCLLPMVVLAGFNIFLSFQSLIGTCLTLLGISWCSLSASKLLVIALNLDRQKPLVAYPCVLLYFVFALLIRFLILIYMISR